MVGRRDGSNGKVEPTGRGGCLGRWARRGWRQSGEGGRSFKWEGTEWEVGRGGVRGMGVGRGEVEAPGLAMADGNSEKIRVASCLEGGLQEDPTGRRGSRQQFSVLGPSRSSSS